MDIFCTALSAILYGCIGYFGNQLMSLGFSVCDLLLWRFFISALLLSPCLVMLLKNPFSFDWKSILFLFFVGALFYGGGTACYFESTKTIGTGLGMVIFFTFPLFVALLSCIVNKAPLNKPTILSLSLIAMGLVLIAFGDPENTTINSTGLCYALLSGFGYGLYVFLSKESSKNVPSSVSAFMICLGNAAAFFLYSLLKQDPLLMPTAWSTWQTLFLFALIGTVLPVFFLLYGMKTLSANKASIISVLEPVTILAVGALILNEPVSSLQLLGSVIILLSAVVVQFDTEKAPANPEITAYASS